MTVSAATSVAGVIGDPIRHSLSPAIHNAAFAALGLDWVFVAFEVADGNAEAAVRGAAALSVRGLSVTMPHKAAVIPALDRLTATARALGAVNAIYRVGGDLVGDSTDGIGLVDALRHDEGVDPRGARCVVFGAGGAARSVVHALGQAGAGAADVAVVNRTTARAAAAAALAGDVGRVGAAGDIRTADIIINATPVGMAGVADGGLVLDPGLLRSGQVVVELIVHPVETPLLDAARAAGAHAVQGLGMLVHQAAHAFQLWTGQEPPLEAMWVAARGRVGPHPDGSD